MRRRKMSAGVGVALVLAAVGLVIAAQPAAAATLTTGAAAYSAGASNGTAALHSNLDISTSLGGIVDPQIDPVIKNDLKPLIAALTATNNTAISSSLGTSSGLTAATNGTQTQASTAPAAFPNDATPSPCTSTDAIAPCYSKSDHTAIDDSPLVTADVGAVAGYTEQVAASADATNPIFGRAKTASASVSVLPGLTSLSNPVVSATSIDSIANCPNDGPVGSTKPNTPPSANVSVNNVTMLGGLVSFDVANGNIENLNVNGTTYSNVVTMPTVTVNGMTISSYGYSLSVSIPLTVNQVIENVGLPASAVSDLESFSATSTVALQLIVGPRASLTANTAIARGLGIGADLSGTLEFNLYNLATADVNLPSGVGGSNFGNLLDLRLAYANCNSGTTPPAGTPAIPPALV